MSNNKNRFSAILAFTVLIASSSILAISQPKQALANIGNCGSKKWQRIGLRDSYGNANFADDCKQHDECYDTLGKTKEECDREFHAGMRESCKKAYNSSFHVVQRRGCLEVANTYYSGVNRLAGDAYRDAQKKARSANSEAKSSWQRIAGSANDVAVDWVIGTNPEQGGYGIYRWNGSDWDKIPGSAVRIGGNSKNPWVVNKFNEIFRWTGSDWQKMPGSAHDVADGWVIGTNPEQGGYGIYRWNGSDWDKIPGSAVRIGGNSKNPWVVNKFNEIFRWTGSDWQKMPGSAHDVGSGWVIGTNPEQGGYGIYRWNGSDWDKISGSAIHIGDSGDKPWVVNKQKHIFRQ